MKGYPGVIARRQDFVNLLAIPQYRGKALEALKKLYAIADDTITVAATLIEPTHPKLGYNTTQVPNPNPLWRQKGFESKEDLKGLIDQFDH